MPVSVDGIIETNQYFKEYLEKYPEQAKVVFKTVALTRSKGRHPCAYLIANKRIKDFIPLTPVSGTIVTQFTAEDAEAAGLLEELLLSMFRKNTF